MRMSMEREKVRFPSGGTECAAWHYPGTNGACVVMAPGGGVTKEPGTDPFAARFHAAGFSVLAFDYRRFGESGGAPRQILDIEEQLADWRAAIARAAILPGVDPARVAAWGFSASGGHIFQVAGARTAVGGGDRADTAGRRARGVAQGDGVSDAVGNAPAHREGPPRCRRWSRRT